MTEHCRSCGIPLPYCACKPLPTDWTASEEWAHAVPWVAYESPGTIAFDRLQDRKRHKPGNNPEASSGWMQTKPRQTPSDAASGWEQTKGTTAKRRRA